MIHHHIPEERRPLLRHSESLKTQTFYQLPDLLLIVVYVLLDAATLTEVFPRFFLGCKANARV